MVQDVEIAKYRALVRARLAAYNDGMLHKMQSLASLGIPNAHSVYFEVFVAELTGRFPVSVTLDGVPNTPADLTDAVQRDLPNSHFPLITSVEEEIHRLGRG